MIKTEKYKPYKSPPNFEYSHIHAEACYIYKDDQITLQVCPCCGWKIGVQRLTMCDQFSKFSKISEQITICLQTQYIYIWVIGILSLYKMIQYGYWSHDQMAMQINFTINQKTFNAQIGYYNFDTVAQLTELIMICFLVFVSKLILRYKKYKIINQSNYLWSRTLQLRNVSQINCENQIRDLINKPIQQIIFTYRSASYKQQVMQYYKKRNILKNNHQQHKINKETYKEQLNKLEQQQEQLRNKKKRLIQDNNRLDTVFVVLQSNKDQQQVLKLTNLGLFRKLFAYIMPCVASKSFIGNRHIVIEAAPAPEDLNWDTLQKSKCSEYVVSILTNSVCAFLIGVGFVAQYIFFNESGDDLIMQIVKGTFIQVFNFILASLLEYSAQKIERHSTISNKHLSLMRKMSAYIFFNLTLPSVIIFLLHCYSGHDYTLNIQQLAMSMSVITVINVIKPLTVGVVQLIQKQYAKWSAKRLGNKSTLCQQQANKLFQPIQFPISTVYALFTSSILTVILFISFFQMLLLVQLFAIIIMLYSTKRLLTGYCKKPQGLKRKISNLSQQIFSFLPHFCYLGRILVGYFLQDSKYFFDFLYNKKPIYCIAQWFILFIMIYSDKIAAAIMKKCKKHSTQQANEPLLSENCSKTYQKCNPINSIQNAFNSFIQYSS